MSFPSTVADFVEVCVDLPQIGAMEREIVWICLAVVFTQSGCDCGVGEELWVITHSAKASRESARLASAAFRIVNPAKPNDQVSAHGGVECAEERWEIGR